MLAKPNRLRSGLDYRSTVRRGRKVSASALVVYLRNRHDDGPARFGFIVSKAVGNAVVRNRTRRRLKAVTAPMVPSSVGFDVVVRALPALADAPWSTLQEDISRAISRGISR